MRSHKVMAPNNPIEFMVPMSDDLISTHTIFSAFTIACTEHETCVPLKVQVRNHNAAPLEMYALLEKCNKRALLNQSAQQKPELRKQDLTVSTVLSCHYGGIVCAVCAALVRRSVISM